jgi:hypothetical protein
VSKFPTLPGSFWIARYTARTSDEEELTSGSAAVPVIEERFVVSAPSGPAGNTTAGTGGVPSKEIVARPTK